MAFTSWYALAVNAGQEKKIRERILHRLERSNQTVRGLAIVAPEEEVLVRTRTEVQKKRQMSMPGYLLLCSPEIDESALHTIGRVKGVLGFLGGNDQPTPLPAREVEKILGTAGGSGSPSSLKKQSLFEAGDMVTIIEGPLSDFTGKIIDLDIEKESARVEVEIFGRQTPSTVSLSSLRRA